MKQISVVEGKFIRKYTIPVGLSFDKEFARVNTLPHLELYVLDESEIDQLIDRLLEIRKEYTDDKNKQSQPPKEKE